MDRAVTAARAAFEDADWPRMSGRERGRAALPDRRRAWRRAPTSSRGWRRWTTASRCREARDIDVKDVDRHLPLLRGLGRQDRGRGDPRLGALPQLHPPRAGGRLRRRSSPGTTPCRWRRGRWRRRWPAGTRWCSSPPSRRRSPRWSWRASAHEAGLPAGVLNVVPGYGETAGAALVRHPGVDKIAFTGSTAVGKVDPARGRRRRSRRSRWSWAGRARTWCFADADLDAAVKGATMAIFYNTGQACTAGSRLLVEESVHEEFVERLVERARGMTPGDPLRPEDAHGPAGLAGAARPGAGLHREGPRGGRATWCSAATAPEGTRNGYFLNPTVFDRRARRR